MLRGLLVSATVVVGVMSKQWVKEDGWISTCTAAGCPGRQYACLEYVVNGTRFYCYRNYSG
jgi:hypothetical protein